MTRGAWKERQEWGTTRLFHQHLSISASATATRMAAPWACCLIAAIIVRLSSSACQPEAVQDGPILTRISEPVAHAEGPHWDPTEKVLYYVDIAGQALHRYDPATKSNKFLKFDKPVSLVVPIRGQKYKFVLGLGRELVLLTWEWNTGVHHHSTIVTVDEQEPKNRFNDGKADAKGRMWAGTMGFEQPVGNVVMNVATFYRLDNDPSKPCTADVELRPVSISNGLAWSHDNKVLYYIDTPTRKIAAFDFDLEKGTISNRRSAFEFGEVEGNPDGMTIDADGHLWIACWGGSQVIQVDPKSGKLLRSIKIPASRVSSVAWGGPRLETLYVTTMRLGLNNSQLLQEPHAGSVWEITNLKAIGTSQYTAVVNCKCKH